MVGRYIGNKIENCDDGNASLRGQVRNFLDDTFIECACTHTTISPPRGDNDVRPEGAEFGGDAALGVDLKIQEGGGNRGASAQREQDHEQAAAIRGENSAEDAPEHFA